MSAQRQARVAVVGTGRWGQNHVRTWHKLGVLRALCEPEAATRAHLPQDVPCFTDLGALLADCPVDIVVLATPASTHAALAEQALRAGADVLIEKPMALSVAEAQGVLQTAETEGRLVAVGHLLLYHPAVVELSRLLQAGALGRVQRIIARRLNFGTLRSHENVLWSFGPHDFALLSHLLGQAPVSVRASGQAVVDPNVTDMVDVHLRYASGVQATVQLSWLHPVKEHRLIVIGERQMAVFDDTLPWADKLTLYPHRIEAGRPPKAIKAEGRPVALIPALPLEQQGRAVLETWRSRRPALADGAHGLAVLRLLCAAEQALAVPDGATLAPPDAVAVPTRPAPPQHLQHPSARIHPSAEVEAGARLGEGVRIWHQAHVMAGAQLGDGVSLGQNVFVGAGVHIGAGSKLQNNVSVFEGVHLAEAVFCGPGCIFTNVKRPRADHPRRDAYLATKVGAGATLGAGSIIVCGVRIGARAMVGAGAVVTQDVPAHALVVGNPARQVGWVSDCGEALQVQGQAAACARCQQAYRRTDTGWQAQAPTQCAVRCSG